MDKRNRKKGLVVIADEVQGSDQAAIEDVIEDARAEFPVTKGSTRPPTLRGIPHAVVFNASGKLVFAGHPMDDAFEDTIKDALREVDMEDEGDDSGLPSAPEPIIAARAWTNSEGKTITAAVMSIDEGRVVFKLANNGREVPYEIAKLSEADQEIIKEKAANTEAGDE